MGRPYNIVVGGLMVGFGSGLLLDVIGHPWGELMLDMAAGLFAVFAVVYGLMVIAGLHPTGGDGQ